LFSGGAPIKEAHHQKEKNQFGITPTTKLTIGITIFIFNNPLKLKQVYYDSRGKKKVIDVINILCACNLM
jgi:hypothetical protein